MTNRRRSFALYLAGTLLTLGSGAHAWSGRAMVGSALNGSPSGEGAMAVLLAGWQLGSVSLLAFGLLVLNAGLDRSRGKPMDPMTLWIIALALTVFGAAALVFGDRTFALFYAGYLVLGGLVAIGAGSTR